MKALLTIGLAVMFGAGILNAAEPHNTVAAPNEAIIVNKLDQRVCRYESKVGTHFRKRTCRTRRQWEAVDEVNQAAVRDEFNRIDVHSQPSPSGQ